MVAAVGRGGTNLKNTYILGIPDAEVHILDRAVSSGTEKVIHRAMWRGKEVAALEILGGSNQFERRIQRHVAEHPVLGNHPHLVKIYGESESYVLNEWACHGSLANYDGSPTAYSTSSRGVSTIITMALQLCAASQVLLEAGLVHRDLAARNVLAFSLDPPLVKLTDFGLVCGTDEEQAWPRGHAMGTRWMAPEVQPTPKGAVKGFGEKTEVYSLGCFIFEAATGAVPYPRTGNSQIGSLKALGQTLPWTGCPSTMTDPGLRGVVDVCCEFYAANRPTLAQLTDMLKLLEAPAPPKEEPWVPTEPLLRRFERATWWPKDVVEEMGVAVSGKGRRAVYSVTGFFSDEVCDAFVSDLTQFHKAGRTTSRANSNNRFSLRLNEVGYEQILTDLVREVASPLFAGLIKKEVRLKYRHAHTVQRVAEDSKSPLPGSNRGSLHTDGSDVTINVNIGGEWEGGNLKFFDEGEKPTLVLPQSKGQALFHYGDFPHQAALLDSGFRFNLVIWCDLIYEHDS